MISLGWLTIQWSDVAALALAMVGGILYRVRDGWLGEYIPGGSFSGRLCWALPTSVLMAWALRAWWVAPLALPAWMLGVSVGWGSYHDLGRSPPTDEKWAKAILRFLFRPERVGTHFYDFVGMTIRGAILTGPPAIVLALGEWRYGLVFLICGLALGMLYELGWLLHRFTTHHWPEPFGAGIPPALKPKAGIFIDGGGAWASIFVGMAIWGLLAQWGMQ